jgi:hypothetical protein
MPGVQVRKEVTRGKEMQSAPDTEVAVLDILMQSSRDDDTLG